MGGTFWLTRLARDREAGVRVAAVSLLAHLALPQAPATRRMLLQGWPEAGTAMLKVLLPLSAVLTCHHSCYRQHGMLLQGWPEAGTVMLKVILPGPALFA